MENIIVTTPENIKQIFLDALQTHEKQKEIELAKNTVLTLSEVKKRAKIGDKRLKTLIEKGIIKTTITGKITEYECDKIINL